MIKEGQFRDYSNYIIYSDGRIYSKRNKKFLTMKISHDGYGRTQLYKDKKYKNYNFHRVVAEVFIPNPDNKPFVNHINGNKLDNRVENLEWCTQSENIKHAWKNGLSKPRRNEADKRSKRIDQLTLDGEYIRTFPSTMEIERQLGIPHSNISVVCKGKGPLYTAGGYKWRYSTTSND